MIAHSSSLTLLNPLMNRIIHHLRSDYPDYFSHGLPFPLLLYSKNTSLVLNHLSISPLYRVETVSALIRRMFLWSFKSIEFKVISLIPLDSQSIRLGWNFRAITRWSNQPKTYNGTILFLLQDSQKICKVKLETIHPIPSSLSVKPIIWWISRPRLVYYNIKK